MHVIKRNTQRNVLQRNARGYVNKKEIRKKEKKKKREKNRLPAIDNRVYVLCIDR